MNRYEIKYVLNEATNGMASNWMYSCTSAKRAFPSRYINSVYFDTPTFDSAKDNLIGLSNRFKYRLRWYSHSPNGNVGHSFILERKTRDGRLGSKARWDLDDGDINIEKSRFRSLLSIITKNSDFKSPYALLPSLQVQYHRHYFEAQYGVRFTFDDKITFYQPRLDRTLFHVPKIKYPKRIMEIKFPPEAKNIVSRGLRDFPISPRRHSKYLAGLATFHQADYR